MTRRVNAWNDPLAIVTGVVLGLSAVDGDRLAASWPIDLAVLVGAATIGALALRHAMDANEPKAVQLPRILLVSWVVWAAFASGVVGGPAAIANAGAFAAILLSVTVIARRFGAQGIAATMVLGFAVHLAVAIALILTTSIDPRYEGRLQLVSLEANQLARVAVLAAVSSGYLLLTRLRSVDVASASRFIGPLNGMLLGVTLLSSAIVATTASRTGAAILVLGMAILASHLLPWRATVSLAAAGLLGLSLLVSGIGVGLPENFATIADRSTERADSLSGRDKLWPAIFDGAMDNPIAGIGLGNDRTFMQQEIDVGWSPQHTHNLALHLLLTTGFIGLALAGIAMLSALVMAAAGQHTLALAFVTIVLVDGISEPVIRVPSFGWAAVCAACVLITPLGSGRALASDHGHADRSLTRG